MATGTKLGSREWIGLLIHVLGPVGRATRAANSLQANWSSHRITATRANQ